MKFISKRFSKDPHAIFTIKIAQWLKKRFPQDEIRAYLQKIRPQLRLKNNIEYLPDIWNKTKKQVYEIHYRGQRKGDEFQNLPEGWKGINVFYDEVSCPEVLIIKDGTFTICQIHWALNEINFFLEQSYLKPAILKNLEHLLNINNRNDPHFNYLLRIFFWIKKQWPKDKLSADTRLISGENVLFLTNGKKILPDIQNKTKKYVYEVHYRGERKSEEFDLLPIGWKGINVFYDEMDNSEMLIIKDKEYKIKQIIWSSQ